MKDKTELGNSEVDILKQLQGCDNVVRVVADYHQDFQTILITEYLAGRLQKTFTKDTQITIQLSGGPETPIIVKITSMISFHLIGED